MTYEYDDLDDILKDIYNEAKVENSGKAVMEIISSKYEIPQETIEMLSTPFIDFIGNQLSQSANMKLVIAYVLELIPLALSAIKSNHTLSIVFTFGVTENGESTENQIPENISSTKENYKLN